MREPGDNVCGLGAGHSGNQRVRAIVSTGISQAVFVTVGSIQADLYRILLADN